MDAVNERIGKYIEALRIKKTHFANQLNVSQAFISQLTQGAFSPSDRIIADICREFNVNELWLRTGEGKMFTQMSRTDEIFAFVGNILRGEPDFRQKFISVSARITPDEWQLLEKKVLKLSEEMKKLTPDGASHGDSRYLIFWTK